MKSFIILSMVNMLIFLVEPSYPMYHIGVAVGAFALFIMFVVDE